MGFNLTSTGTEHQHQISDLVGGKQGSTFGDNTLS